MSEPLRFTDAPRLHARRFNKHPLASAMRLLSADQRITHPDGGIALVTEAGHAIRATALFAATYGPAFLGMLYGFAIGSVALVAVTVPAVLGSALVLGSRCERQIRARRTFDTAGHPWVLSDVATEPHRGIGTQLLAEVVRQADDANADLVLTVGRANEIARALYACHRFLELDDFSRRGVGSCSWSSRSWSERAVALGAVAREETADPRLRDVVVAGDLGLRAALDNDSGNDHTGFGHPPDPCL